jgi:hypothetical protein
MQISDEAVEAAARETYRVAAEFAYESDSWDDLSDGQREAFAEDARTILEAAAPYIAAEAWDRCAASIVDEHGNRLIPYENTNPYRSQA